MELYLERINKNWKTRRKKPPNKIVNILMSSLNVKEFNKKKNERQSWERKLKKEKKNSEENENELKEEKIKLGKINSMKEIVEHEY
jgi:hypothetical protein